MEEDKKEDVDLKSISTGIEVDPIVNFTDLLNDRENTIPNFSALSVEAIEDMDQFKNFELAPSSKEVDKAVIATNQAAQDTRISMMSYKGQPVSERGNDVPNRNAGLDNTIMGSPAEMDTEELPANMGGATPRASSGKSNLRRGSSDIRTTGNPYGYA